MKIKDLSQLVSKVNDALGDFCWEFAERRKVLAKLGRAPARDRLFEYDPDSGRDWAINQGGGTEIQFHLFFRPDSWGYGLGFNAQYVPFKNDKTPREYILPFVKAYKALENSKEVKRLKKAGFHFVYGDEKNLTHIKDGAYYLFGKELRIGGDNELSEHDFDCMISEIKGGLFTLYCAIFEFKNKGDDEMTSLQENVDLLAEKHNLVLTGAPGTGKTFLAWQMASAMTGDVNPMEKGNEDKPHPHIGFCQFHPSMDYTDFVEGLRPTVSGNGQVGFELKDGIFKDFCRRAALGVSSNFEEVWERFIDDVARTNSRDNPLDLKTPQGKKFRVFANSNGNLSLMTGEGVEVQGSLTKEKIASFLSETPYEFWGGYYRGVLAHLKEEPYNLRCGQENNDQKFVFIIDEINRGDIAKIFGELFFAMDPGYRGGKGRIDTQYGNLIPPGDSFKRFYVPDNVYIIGTMNDIDRGVESMDFAIRRRFTWKEVTPDETQEAILRSKIKNDKLFEKVKNRMDNLNAAISDVNSGLGSAYCIGGAYFTHLRVSEDENTDNFKSLWDYHLEPLLREYLRGQEPEDIKKRMKVFEDAFKNEAPLQRSKKEQG